MGIDEQIDLDIQINSFKNGLNVVIRELEAVKEMVKVHQIRIASLEQNQNPQSLPKDPEVD